MRFWIGIALVVLGGFLGYLGVVEYQEWQLSAASSAAPEEISLKDLLARGAEGNPHITLKEFGFCENFVYTVRREDGPWSRVWVPVVPDDQKSRRGPLGEPLPPVARVQVLVTSTRVKNQSDLDKLCHLPTLDGMVVNKLVSLSEDQKVQLRDSYPETDFDRCLIIEAGRQPASSGKVMGFLGGGAALLLAGLGVLLWAWKG